MPAIEPILDEHLEEVCAFWRHRFRSVCGQDIWMEAFRRRWHPHRPNNGFLLRDGGKLVGTFGAIYSQQIVRGKVESFCNMANWYVDEPYKNFSMALLFTLLRQEKFHFTNVTPSPTAVQVLERLGFRPLASELTAVISVASPFRFRRDVHVLDEIAAIEAELPEERRKICRDHAGCPNVQQLAVGSADFGYCHVIFSRGRCRYLPCAVILDVSNPGLLREFWPDVADYFLRRRKAVVVRLPRRIDRVARLPLAFNVSARGKTFFRSPTLDADDISLLYSEAVALRGC